MIFFEVKGQPMGKQRPKFTKMGQYVKVYTPQETVNYETLVKMEYKRQCKEYFGSKPIIVRIKAYFKIPKSFTMKKKFDCIDGKIRPTSKPDTDNIAKIICDSLNNVAYDDDKQIIELEVEKYYGVEPRVLVSIME